MTNDQDLITRFKSQSRAHIALVQQVEPKQASLKKTEVIVERADLTAAGWKEAEFLPPGWLYRKSSITGTINPSRKSSFSYRTREGVVLSSLKSVVTYMVDHSYPGDQVETFKENSKLINFRDDESLPAGWKFGTVDAGRGQGTTMHKYLSPGGDIFNNRATAVKFMIGNNDSEDAINKMKAGLLQDGWSFDDQLPSQWMIKVDKSKKATYLSPTFDTLRNNGLVLNYMEIKGYEPNEISRMKDYMYNRTKDKKFIKSDNTAIDESNLSWKKDPALPQGWVISEEKGGVLIKNPGDAVFASRKEAIVQMIKERYSPTEIFKLWNTLEREGWVTDDQNLPAGWKKKYFSEKGIHHYLSPMMEEVTSSEALLEMVKKDNNYTKEEINKIEKWKTLGN